MTQTGSQWLTAVASSPITGPVSEVELQNENHRAHSQEKMWYMVLFTFDGNMVCYVNGALSRGIRHCHSAWPSGSHTTCASFSCKGNLGKPDICEVQHRTRSGEPTPSVTSIFQHRTQQTVNAYSRIAFPEPKNTAMPELGPIGLNFASLVAS